MDGIAPFSVIEFPNINIYSTEIFVLQKKIHFIPAIENKNIQFKEAATILVGKWLESHKCRTSTILHYYFIKGNFVIGFSFILQAKIITAIERKNGQLSEIGNCY